MLKIPIRERDIQQIFEMPGCVRGVVLSQDSGSAVGPDWDEAAEEYSDGDG